MSAFDELMDLAKSNRTMGHNPVHWANHPFVKTRFRKTRMSKQRFAQQADFGKVRTTRTTLKSVDDEEKSIGNTIAPYTPHVVRAHKRVMAARGNKHRVNAFQKRRFKDPSQMKNIVNVQDV